MENQVTFKAIFMKAMTTVDGGWSVTFHVGNDEAQAIMQLANMRDKNMQVACVLFDEFMPDIRPL